MRGWNAAALLAAACLATSACGDDRRDAPVPGDAGKSSKSAAGRAPDAPVPTTASQPAVPQETRPLNVVLVTIDTLRADALGVYGQTRPASPHIDALAKRGTVFEQCVTSGPNTLPSHATIMTGLYPYAHGARSNAGFILPSASVTLAERLSQAGFATGAEVAAPVIGRQTHLDQGFDHYRDSFDATSVRKTARVATPGGRKRIELEERDAADITARGLEFLREHRRDRFFLWLHYFDPHQLYLAPFEHAKAVPDSPYHAEVHFVDDRVGRIALELERLGLRDHTLVVLTSDHGEGLGEHGEDSHSFLVYETTMHVPLILWGPPEVSMGRRVPGLVRTVDIAPTILDFLELEPLAGAEGVSLRALATGAGAAVSPSAYGESIEFHTTFGADILRFEREGDWKYIHSVEPELYDIGRDPGERINQAERHPERVARLRERLRSRLEAARAVAGAEVALDDAQRTALTALGYLGGESGAAIGDEVATLALRGPAPTAMLPDVATVSQAWSSVSELDAYAEAARLFGRLRDRYPDSAPILRGLALSQMEQGQLDEAIPLFRRSLSIEPCAQGSRLKLAGIYAAQGAHREQRDLLEEGVEACPGLATFRNDLAYLLASSPDEEIRDGERALRLAAELIEASREPDSAGLDTLAVAYAAVGDFENAVATGRRALERARAEQAPPALVALLQQHQEDFEAGRPVRHR